MTEQKPPAALQVQSIKVALQGKEMMQALKDAVPVTARAYLTPERIVRIVTTAVSRSPKLLECVPQTILRSVVDLVQLGLEPGGPLGHGYLVPFMNKHTGKRECQPMVGYQGYLAIARRSGEIESVTAEVICTNDEYDIQFGDEPHVKHRKNLTSDRGEPIAVYCVAKFKGGGKHIEVMTRDEVAAIRSRSKSGDDGPWCTDPDMMARKTVIKRARHYWPMSVEMASAAELDDHVEIGEYARVVDGGKLEQATPGTFGFTAKTKELRQSEEEPPPPSEPPHEEKPDDDKPVVSEKPPVEMRQPEPPKTQATLPLSQADQWITKIKKMNARQVANEIAGCSDSNLLVGIKASETRPAIVALIDARITELAKSAQEPEPWAKHLPQDDDEPGSDE